MKTLLQLLTSVSIYECAIQLPTVNNLLSKMIVFVKRSQCLNGFENIGISHVFFHALTFAVSRGSCLNTRPLDRVFKHPLRDPASVNAMKQTCVIVINGVAS